ncbi:hypothetical protein CK203_041901 [Vitis vinifera]|uniref:Reverse transcriptase/retrotransposon-derived protein RNase H-like domain-containing protein n=1 Tax=Vitis vinifera TaxID=29760 RepID=A0A438FY89_VITVI|nr:hypothetical protein CK203_041901 [Vitis vinifera]
MLKDLNESLGDLDEGLPEPSDLLALCPLGRGGKKFYLYSMGRRHKKLLRRSPKAYSEATTHGVEVCIPGRNKQSLVVISSSLTTPQEDCLLEVLRRCKKAIGWQISDLKGINPLVCTHHIYMEEEVKPVRKPQRSPGVSPTQVVPKKLEITVVQNDKGEEVSTHLTSGFYRRFIKDFSKLARPLCELLVKDAKFVWDDRCQRSFEELKLFLTTAQILRAPNWQLPFEVMCDVSDFAIGAILGMQKPRLIRWILLLQEFNLHIKDKK